MALFAPAVFGNVASLKPTKSQAPTGQTTQRIAPDSSFIEAAEYNATTFTLTINFKKGGQTQHFFVYPAEWQQGLTSPSFGTWYNHNLRGKKMSAKIIDASVGKEK